MQGYMQECCVHPLRGSGYDTKKIGRQFVDFFVVITPGETRFVKLKNL